MSKKMLIDAAHPEETRVVVLDGNRLDDFDFETQNRRQLRGNIYLAKVTRVEPSLQAAFVEYGGNRHGFLAFGEIHPDYYQIPMADREALKAEFEAVESEVSAELEGDSGGGHDEDDENAILEERRRRILTRRYKIQEVIKRRQIMLVQVVKEERGQKGAALTTYMSLAGRYCVLMPNSGRGGGISRKITNATDRKRLKKVAQELEVPPGIGLIVRTAGAKRTKTEIKRDYEYLMRAWETIRDLTMRSIAPTLIYEESSLVKRAIRDLYDKDVDEVQVEGDGAYREAKDFIRMLMPSHAKKVVPWREPTPIFTHYGVERQLETVFSPVVQLRSGGYIVINQTEALVAIDVNSGKATRERNIEQTALKTNLEAADEAARQMRLRDLAGLIVMDFIDMEEARNDRTVEKRMKDALRHDRARTQMGKISGFGLLELSRQRRRTGLLEGSTHVCEACAGAGRVRSVESCALKLLRELDDVAASRQGQLIEARAATEVALYVLNEKREALTQLEAARGVQIRLVAGGLAPHAFEFSAHAARGGDGEEVADGERVEARPQRVERARIAPPPPEIEPDPREEDVAEDGDDGFESSEGAPGEADGDSGARRRRRGRRGGRRRREDGMGEARLVEAAPSEAREAKPRPHVRDARDAGEPAGDRAGRGRRRRRRRPGRALGFDSGEALDFHMTVLPLLGDAAAQAAEDEDEGPEDSPATIPPAAAEPAPIPEPAFAPPPLAEAAAAEVVVAAPEPAAPVEAPAEPEPDYEPDLERREKFFARLSRWGRKSAG